MQRQFLTSHGRYFFHATLARTATDDYDIEDSDDEIAENPTVGQPASEVDEDIKISRSADFQDAMITPKVEEVMDPGLADWFKVDEETTVFPLAHEVDDSATEDDSDHADVAPDAADEVDLDDWFKVEPMNEGSTSTKSVSKLSNYLSRSDYMQFLVQDQHDVKMGENEAAMGYDQEFIFKHLQVAVFLRR